MRTRLTVLNDGTTESHAIVFCEAVLRSVPVTQCQTCPFAGTKSNDAVGDGMVDCRHSILAVPENAATSRFPPAVAAALPVGLALVRPVVCVEDHLPWSELVRMPMPPTSPFGVPVVDHQGALVGFLPSRATALADRNVPVDPIAFVADRAVSDTPVHESESLGDAFVTMGARHVRELTVVGDGLVVVGVLRDVDALHFVAHLARTGKRPQLFGAPS